MGYVWPYRWMLVVATLCGLLKFVLPAATAISLRFLTDTLVAGQAHGTEKTDVIYRLTRDYLNWLPGLLPSAWNLGTNWGQFNLLAISLAVLLLLWALSAYYRGYLANLAGHRIIFSLRTDLYRHITRMGHRFFQQRQSGAIVSRLMGDVALAQNFVGTAMTNIWMDLFSCVFYCFVLASMDLRLTLAALAVFPFYIASMKTFGKASKRTSKEVQAAIENFSGDTQERISGIHVVKSFAAEDREAAKFEDAAENIFDLAMRNARITRLSGTIVQWLTEMATLAIIWYGGYRVFTGQTTIGTVTAFILLVRQLYFPINRISEMNTIFHNSLAAIDRIFEVFDLAPDVEEMPDAPVLPRVEGRIAFEQVTFGYQQGMPVLHSIDLDVAAGEVVALVGPSGAGKSSLIQLIPRFYDPESGSLRVDGRDLREVQIRSLRSQIGIVAQETLLFSGTARDNLLYGRPDATEAQMLAAARAAHAHDFLSEFPEGYDTILGERGARLSGGQRQRLAIARAFLCDPRILILDEATSALDSESELLIQEALTRLMKNRTCIVIAHRLSTILHSDRIVAMDAGRIAEIGPHETLLAADGLYRRLYEAQFGTAARTASFPGQARRFDPPRRISEAEALARPAEA